MFLKMKSIFIIFSLFCFLSNYGQLEISAVKKTVPIVIDGHLNEKDWERSNWSTGFTQLKPVKRRGNRRYYQQEEVLLIRKIRELLYFEGFTIQGAKTKLSDKQFVKATTSEEAIQKAQAELPLSVDSSSNTPADINNFKTQLEDILKILKKS